MCSMSFYKLETISKTERDLSVIVNRAHPQLQLFMTVPRFASIKFWKSSHFHVKLNMGKGDAL